VVEAPAAHIVLEIYELLGQLVLRPPALRIAVHLASHLDHTVIDPVGLRAIAAQHASRYWESSALA